MPARGEIRETISRSLMAGAGTTRELALRSGVGVSAAMYTLRNMVAAGEAAVVETTRVPGCKRPVPVYGLLDDDAAANDGVNWDLVTCWAQWPAQA